MLPTNLVQRLILQKCMFCVSALSVRDILMGLDDTKSPDMDKTMKILR